MTKSDYERGLLRGIKHGLVLVLPFWAVVAYIIWKAVHA